jgi:hypothetical protein
VQQLAQALDELGYLPIPAKELAMA